MYLDIFFNQIMIYHDKTDSLTAVDFQRIVKSCPRRDEGAIKKIMMPYLRRDFKHCWFRRGRTQWLERCGGGDVERHQITGIVLRVCIVRDGKERCLKMEFFTQDITKDMICVSDHNGQWKSYWSTEELELVDNYIRSFTRFTHTHARFSRTHARFSRILTMDSSMARECHNMRLAIADPKTALPHTTDLIFPGCTDRFLHEIYAAHHFLKSPSDICTGADPGAWLHINREMDIPETHTIMVALWYREEGATNYRCHCIGHRGGRKTARDTEFADYEALRVEVIKGFMRSKDIGGEDVAGIHRSEGRVISTRATKTSIEIVRAFQPSDDVVPPKDLSGEVTRTDTENYDEDGGYDTVYYGHSFSYQIQVRWCIVRAARV